MKGYLKGYYGYKNFGDELLLLGLLSFLSKEGYTQLTIETPNPERLAQRLADHQHLFSFPLAHISLMTARNISKYGSVHKIFGGGEVVTDARAFPFNGRNYFLGFFKDILIGNYSLYGGIGTPKKKSTKLLYTYLLPRARRLVVRDKDSCSLADTYGATAEFYHDFAYDVLARFSPVTVHTYAKEYTSDAPYGVLNITPYLWNAETKARVHALIKKHEHLKRYIFPGEIDIDDVWNTEIFQEFPGMERYDRTAHTLEYTLAFLSGASYAIATRLHVILCLHRAGVMYEPLVYQEKIRKLQLA